MRIKSAIIIYILLLSCTAQALENLRNAPINTLLEKEVFSASRKPEEAFNTSTAIFVITQEDIRRSGATALPEILRMVPGLQVARTDSNKWVVTSRGFAGQFNNKLLVQVDGRTIYTPLYSGVYWDVQDVMLEDIKRIEVIRGPGATLWGANAVNGVINIITEEAFNTQGILASGLVGNHEKNTVNLRYGGKIGQNLHYRNYLRHFARDDTEVAATGDNRNDRWHLSKAGFRTDWEKSHKNHFTFQGDAYSGRKHRNLNLPLSDGSLNSSTDRLRMTGFNFLNRWTHLFENNSQGILQTYFDYSSRDYDLLDQDISVLDIDWQHAFLWQDYLDIIWGAGYRRVSDDLDGSNYLNFSPSNRETNLFSFFFQNKYSILPEKLFLTTGSKFEHNDFSGYEIQPSARLSWHPNKRQTFWAAISRAVRTPSRAEHNISLIPKKSSSAPLLLIQEGDENFDSENLIAYEIGYRAKPHRNLSFDFTSFINDYDNLLSMEKAGLTYVEVAPGLNQLALIVNPRNLGSGKSYGFEINSKWQITDNWQVKTAYSFLKLDLQTEYQTSNTLNSEEIATEGRSPKNQLHLASHFNFGEDFELDNHFYYVDSLPYNNIDSYIRSDIRLGWHYNKNSVFSLVVQNIFDDNQQEFVSGLHSSDAQIGRSIFFQASYKFHNLSLE